MAQAALGPAVDQAVSAVLPMLRQKNLKLDVAVGEELPLAAVRETVLRQLALSLLENACRASTQDGRLLVRAETVSANGSGPSTARAVALIVSDAGVGIRAEDRERVFDSQYYLGGGRPIVGLGDNSANLAVVQKLAQASGGDLYFESRAGAGTTFTLRLPAAEVRPWTMLKLKQERDTTAQEPLKPATGEAS